MKLDAATGIFCPMTDGTSWSAAGPDRRTAEHYYMSAIVNQGLRPPLYRVIVQWKVDQYEKTVPVSAAIN